MTDPSPSSPPRQPSPSGQLLEMLNGSFMTSAIAVAAKLGISDLLGSGPKAAVELASVTRVHAQSLYRVLRYLASIGVYAETEDGKFRLTPLAECLRSGGENSLRDWAAMRGEEWVTKPHCELLHAVRTGRPAFDHVFGMNAFEYLGKNPQASKAFDAAMRCLTAQTSRAILDAYDFSEFAKVADIAGGNGTFLIGLLKEYPALTGLLADLPHVVEGGRKAVEAAGLADRCECYPCDFFEEVPAGASAYIFKHIVHDWDDERSIAILKNCRDAIPVDGKLLLIEFVIPEGNDPSLAKLEDIEMLVMTPGGRERTEKEFRGLFEAAGFELTRAVPAASMEFVIEGVPA